MKVILEKYGGSGLRGNSLKSLISSKVPTSLALAMTNHFILCIIYAFYQEMIGTHYFLSNKDVV